MTSTTAPAPPGAASTRTEAMRKGRQADSARRRQRVIAALSQAGAELLVVLGELGDLLPELADVVGLAEAGLAPGLLAERLGQAFFELPDAGGEPR